MGYTREQAEAIGITRLLPPEHPWASGDRQPSQLLGVIADAVAADAVKDKRSKYGAQPTHYNGVRYASKAEANRARALDLDLEAGLVRWWTGQVRFRLGLAELVYICDFLVADRDGIHAEDVKGVETPKFRRDVRLWQAHGPGGLELRVIDGRGRVRERVIGGEEREDG